ncbi:MAG: hypothetical protein RMA76_22590 [Deltaproteobacteria bacterium]|jgi:succinoglycan biosynthesis transport protein ExoP
MAKKGKEIELGSIRLQIDPFILVQRVLMRQKLLLVLVAIIGAGITVYKYKTEPKIYASYGSITVRTEGMDADFSRKFVNRGMRNLNSNEEMMLIINELDLFPSTRANMPYTISLRRMRRELIIKNSQGQIEVIFESRNPREAQRVVAFVVERVLSTFERLLYAPYDRQIDALNRAISELMPKVEDARGKLYEFKAKHPTIAIKNQDLFIDDGSPMGALQAKITRAEQNLRACYGGPKPVTARRPTNGPKCQALARLRAEEQKLLTQYTPQHPSVLAMNDRVEKAERQCEKEQDESMSGLKPGMSQADCVAAAKAKIESLHKQKIDIEKRAIRKPRLQQQWAEVSLEAAQYESQLRALKERKVKTEQDRVMGSSNFTDNFSLVDVPRIPELPAKPERNLFLMTGMAVTAMIGLFLAFLREAFRQRFLDAKEFEEQTGLDVLAVLPDISE